MKPILSLLLLLVGSIVSAAEPLEWKFKVGETRTYEITQTQLAKLSAPNARPQESQATQVTTLSWKCSEVSADGIATLTQTIERIEVTLEGLGQLRSHYHTDNRNAVEGAAAMLAPVFDALVDKPQQAMLSPNGALEFPDAQESLGSAFKKSPLGIAHPHVLLESLASALTLSRASTVTWTETLGEGPTPHAVETTYEQLGPREVKGKSLIALRPTINLQAGAEGMDLPEQSTEGETLFDPEAGCLESSQIVHRVKYHTSEDVTAENEITIEVRRLK